MAAGRRSPLMRLHEPQIASDLAHSREFNLPAPPSFQRVNETGGTTLPAANADWGLEIALDASGRMPSLRRPASCWSKPRVLTCRYAASRELCQVAAWRVGGFDELGQQRVCRRGRRRLILRLRPITRRWLSSPRRAIKASRLPVVSPNVLAVGGTQLTLRGGSYGSETPWSGSGGGPRPMRMSQASRAACN